MKSIITLLTLTSLIVLTGCTAAQVANTNNGSTETLNVNESTEVVNDDTNAVRTTLELSETTTAKQDVDTTDWLTYTNEEYGFSFRYPSDWKITELAYLNGIIALDSPDFNKEGHLVFIEIQNQPISTLTSAPATEWSVNNQSERQLSKFQTIVQRGITARNIGTDEFEEYIFNKYFVPIRENSTMMFMLHDDQKQNKAIIEAVITSLILS